MSELTKYDVLQVGGYPPPYGGITVHIQRLCAHASAANLEVRVADPYSENAPPEKRRLWGRVIVPLHGPSWVQVWQLIYESRQCRVLHFQASSLDHMWLIAPFLMVLRKPYILTIHSGHFVRRFAAFSIIKRYFIRNLIYRCSAVVFVSDEIRSYVESHVVRPRRSLVVPAFIAPVRPKSAHPQIRALRERFSKLVLICGFPLPEYGFESFIEAVRGMRGKGRVAYVVVLYPTADSAVRDKYREVEASIRQQISMFAAEATDVLVLEAMTPEELSAVQVGCDIFVRNTNVDGDSVALREGGYLGCQVVASDAVVRPPGVLIFRAHDADDLRRAIQSAVEDVTSGCLDLPSYDGAGEIIDLYWDVIGRSKSPASVVGGA